MSTRAEILARATSLRAGIQQIFDDAEHWNRRHTPWKGKPIDPDPDGKLRRCADAIDLMFAREAAKLPAAAAGSPGTTE